MLEHKSGVPSFSPSIF